MALKPKRAAVIGIDSAIPHLLIKMMGEGQLPNIKAIMDDGWWADQCIPNLPTITPPNWATIATGALSGTHGQPCFRIPLPGTDPDNAHVVQQLNAANLKVEHVWKPADRAGKRCLVLNYPTSWPCELENGIIIGGRGLAPCENRDGLPDLDSVYGAGKDFVVSTSSGPFTFKGTFAPAEGWRNCELGKRPLEMKVELPFFEPDLDVDRAAPEHAWWLLARQSGKDGYDSVLLSPTKDAAQAFCTLGVNQWSKQCFTSIRLADGKTVEAVFACKLLELDEEAENLRLLVGAFTPLDSSWSNRPDLFKEIYSGAAVSHWASGFILYDFKMIDSETWHEMIEHDRHFLLNSAKVMISKGEWDLFYMHSHVTDWMYHQIFPQMVSKDERVSKKAWEDHRRILGGEDWLVGELARLFGDETALVLVSDHGAGPDGPIYFDPIKPLIKDGLAAELYAHDESAEESALRRILAAQTGTVKYGANIDYAKTKAVPRLKNTVVINLKGRDPHGIVEPEDYEKVQREIIDSLLSWRDPETGRRPVVLALSREDAMALDVYGEHIGDVIFAVYPEFSAQHGPILGTASWGEYSNLRSLLCLSGPGIKRGERYRRPAHLQDIVPTLCYLVGLPVPNGVDGAVLYDALKNPNQPFDDINRLKNTVESLEAALERSRHNPHGKETCL